MVATRFAAWIGEQAHTADLVGRVTATLRGPDGKRTEHSIRSPTGAAIRNPIDPPAEGAVRAATERIAQHHGAIIWAQ